MPKGNSTARPKNRDEKKATQKYKDIAALEKKLFKQFLDGDITESAMRKAKAKLEEARSDSYSKGVSDPRDKEAVRKYYKKNMMGLSKGGMAKKKSGYAKGGMVSCGASMKPGQKRTK